MVEPRRFRKLTGELSPIEAAGEAGRVALEVVLLAMPAILQGLMLTSDQVRKGSAHVMRLDKPMMCSNTRGSGKGRNSSSSIGVCGGRRIGIYLFSCPVAYGDSLT